MTTAAFLFMSLSVSGVVALVGWCYYRVVSTPPALKRVPPGRTSTND